MMNMQHATNLSTEDFIRMFECEAKTPLESALFSRLIEHLGIDDMTEGFDEIFGSMEEAITDAENEIDDILDRHGDDISDEVSKLLHERAMTLGEVNEKQRNAYEEMEYVQ